MKTEPEATMYEKQEQKLDFSCFRKKGNWLLMLVLVLIFGFILISTLFYQFSYQVISSLHDSPEQTDTQQTKSNFYLKFYSNDLTENARLNLSKEFQSYNIQSTDYNFYAQKGALLDKQGNVIYSEQTLPVNYTTFYEEGRNRLCKYLYGDLQYLYTPYGLSPYMRGVPNINPDTHSQKLPDFPTGYDIQLTIDSELECPIYDLLTINHIKGGCIIQDLPTGKIEVMTATSVTSAESEKSQLTQLESCLNTDFLFQRIQALPNPEEQALTKQFFDYQVKETQELLPGNTPEEPSQTIKKYCFRTDFDLLTERPDNMKELDNSEVSPLHLNSITQRLFSGKAIMPTIIEKINPSGKAVSLPEQEIQSIEGISLENELKNCYETYTPPHDPDYQVSVLRYNSGHYADFKYLTGIISKTDGSVQKTFTLYSKDEKIMQLTDCLVWFIHEHNPET